MKLIVSIILSMLVVTQANASCKAVRSTVDNAAVDIFKSLETINKISEKVSLVSQKKDLLCLQIGKIQANATVISELVLASIGPVVSLECYRADSETRELIADNLFHMFSFGRSLQEDCSERRNEAELKLKVEDGLSKLKQMTESLVIK